MHGRRFWLFNGGLLAAVALLAYFGLSSLFDQASAHNAIRTATVQTGTVTQTVTASGNVSPAESENVDFATGGTVTAINVTVGQRVTAGQTLASLDPTAAQAALTAAQDNLSAAQDNLANAQNGNESPPAVTQDNATVAADQQAVASAQATLTADQTQLAADQAACSADPPAAGSSGGSAGGSAGGSGGGSSGGSAGGSGTGSGGGSGSTSAGTSASSGPCSQATAEQQSVTQANDSLTQADNALNQENLAIAAKRYVNPATVLQDQAQVTSAQETVTQDQRTLDETTLVAPFDGTVTALNGAVGQTVSGGGNSAASSGGSGSSGSGSAGGGNGAGAASAAGSSAGSSGSSSAFLTLANLSNLQVVAGFPEASAVKVKVGQPATVTLSATGATVPGSVTAVSPTPTVVSNVVTYDVTISLQNPPSSVQTGMTATVAVVVASAANALELPSSAITTTGRASTVELLKNGKQVLTTVTTGLVGDTTTQILSGVSVGEQVVEPSVTVSSGTGTTGTGARPGGFGGFFGGGGGLGGAARGG